MPDHPKADEVFTSLERELAYLNNYGGLNEAGRRHYQVTLGWDIAKLSFSIIWARRDKDGFYQPALWGGLQCNAVNQSFGSVQVGELQWWSVNS